MSIQNAMQAGVAGLRVNSKAVANISSNIANSGTIGYKRSFTQMVSQVVGDSGSVSGVSRKDVETGGPIISSSSATDLAIDGDGFFVVMKDPNSTDQSNFMLTRAGSFEVDKNGYLVNSAGYYLAGYSYDDTGSIPGVDRNTFNSLGAVKAGAASLTAEASAAGSISGNLPSSLTGTGVAQDPFISSMTYFTALGEQEGLTFSWTPDTAVDNAWSVEVAGSDGTVYGTVDVTFSDSGPTAGAPASYAFTADPGLAAPAAFAVDANGNMTITVNNGTAPQVLDIALGAVGSHDGITQFDGDYEPQKITVDGSSTAALEKTEIDKEGNIVGVFDNGKRRSLYQIPVATVDNPAAMDAVTGNAYTLTLGSGDAVMNVAGSGAGTVESGATEASNVDIAQEMTDLIQVQRAYSSNAKIITTSDEMLQEVNNLKR
ncbi:flagellar hook protein FlgE [Leisingera caerulea]|uniref:flagellar hook protein FlgE n=1 Tax=Leisingera caerulea TaxID=506591 RepID=UPI00041E27D2|nr:flagellar hook-basal body complex protein [Leisingera caerulea]